MEIDEVVARVLRRYWPLLLLALLLPVLVTGYALRDQRPMENATTRIDSPSSVETDAGITASVSQVKAFATSRNVLSAVITAQGLDRTPKEVAPRIMTEALGSSSVVEMIISDPDPGVARRLTDGIAAKVVEEINRSRGENLNTQIASLDDQIGTLSRRLAVVSTRAQTPTNFDAINEKATLQTRLDGLQAERRELRRDLTEIGVARVVQTAVVEPAGTGKIARIMISALIGLIVGILLTILIEAFRPTVPGAGRVARRLGTPLLGRADRSPAELVDLGRRVRLAAKRAGVVQVALVSAQHRPVPPELVSKVAAAVYGNETGVVGGPAQSPAEHGAPPPTLDDAPLDNPDPAPSSPTAPSSPFESDAPAGGASVNHSAPTAPGTSVVRSTAATTATSVRAVSPAERERVRAEVVGSRSAARHPCHVHAFEDIDPGADDDIGVVAVAGKVTRLADLDSVQDLIAASGWPLLGVAATSRRRKRRASWAPSPFRSPFRRSREGSPKRSRR